MAETMRFRSIRSIQRQHASFPPIGIRYSEVIAGWLGSENATGAAEQFLAERGLTGPARKYNASGDILVATLFQARALDAWLLLRQNSPGWQELDDYIRGPLDGDPADIGRRWQPLWEDLSNVLVACTISPVHIDLRSDTMRLSLVIGLIRLLAGWDDLPNDFSLGNTPEEQRKTIFECLTRRLVLLPEEVLSSSVRQHSILARPAGVTDLWVVRDEWARYELGEIAHIENVLKGESKVRRVEKLTENETTVLTGETRVSDVTEESSSASRFELASESQRETDLSAHIEGQVDTSGQYGPTRVDTHLGGTFDYAVAESTNHAVKQASETIQRALTRIHSSVTEQRTTRSLTRVRETDSHTLNNVAGEDNVSGIYRWVDKIQRVQVFRYPNRLVFDFQVPEPASFLRWLASRPITGVQAIKPVPLTVDGTPDGAVLRPDLISDQPNREGHVYYQDLVQRYYARGITPPPASTFAFVSMGHPDADTDVEENNKPPQYASNSIVVPDGYQAERFEIYGVGTNGVQEPGSSTGWIETVIGTDFPGGGDPSEIWRIQGTNIFRGRNEGQFRSPVTGTVPVQLATDDAKGLLLTIRLTCTPTERAMRSWQHSVYDAIASSYWELQSRYDDEISQRTAREGIAIEGESPVRNEQTVLVELRKFVVEMLLGDRFQGRDAIQEAAEEQPPLIDLEAAQNTAAEVQFLEQAFEWENLTYVLYPYYWASGARWAELSSADSPDPIFTQFLRSGSARVSVPARPGFEAAAMLYTRFGSIWAGGPAPGPNDELYISVAEEIRAQQTAPPDGIPGESWEVRMPTTFVYLEPLDSTLPLQNASASLPVDG